MTVSGWGRLALVLLVVAGAACGPRAGAEDTDDKSDSAADASVEPDDGPDGDDPLATSGPSFVNPEHGADLLSPVNFRIDPGDVDPTGETVPADAGGRFHLLVDRECVANGDPLPVGEEGHHAFERDATELTVELPAGAHQVCVQFGNAFDVAYYATDEMTISVQE